MALRIVADSLDEVPEPMRAGAKQQPGVGFVVSEIAEGWAFEDVAGLKKTLSIELDKRKNLERAIKAYDGLAPESASEAREALERLKAGQLRGSKEIDEFKLQVEKKMAGELAAIQAKLDARTAALKQRMVQSELSPVIAKHGGSEAIDAILTLAQQHVRVEETADGSLSHSIVDRDGKPRITTKSGSSDPMGFEELIVEMRNSPSTRGLFRAQATGGSGSTSQTGESGRAGNPGQKPLSARELFDRANAVK